MRQESETSIALELRDSAAENPFRVEILGWKERQANCLWCWWNRLCNFFFEGIIFF